MIKLRVLQNLAEAWEADLSEPDQPLWSASWLGQSLRQNQVGHYFWEILVICEQSPGLLSRRSDTSTCNNPPAHPQDAVSQLLQGDGGKDKQLATGLRGHRWKNDPGQASQQGWHDQKVNSRGTEYATRRLQGSEQSPYLCIVRGSSSFLRCTSMEGSCGTISELSASWSEKMTGHMGQLV